MSAQSNRSERSRIRRERTPAHGRPLERTLNESETPCFASRRKQRIDIARWGRAGRILRIFRILWGLRASQSLASSIAILHFESGPDANIVSAGDAMWWAFARITTVGSGDRYPTTGEGRMVAVLLMSADVGLFGTFSGFLASWFIGEEEKAENAELVQIRGELERVRELLELRDNR